MKLFDKLNGLGLPCEITFFLKANGYYDGRPVNGEKCASDGLCKWYTGSAYRTHVCIAGDKIFFHKETIDESFVNGESIDIPENEKDSLSLFRDFLNKAFNEKSYMFDLNLFND